MSREMDRLMSRWQTGGWPKWLDWVEIVGVRGWTGQRIDFKFPMVAIVGENGVGKSTVLQAVASLYKGPRGAASSFASDFFPTTPWDNVTGVSIRFSGREGNNTITGSIRKPSERWRGNPERPERHVRYVDLRRTQPIVARPGFQRLTKANVQEAERTPFEVEKVARFSAIVGRQYTGAHFARGDVDDKRWVPLAQSGGAEYSGFHQGAGETTVADLLRIDFPNTAIVLIDEIETSLHPRAQRRLIRDLANEARLKQLQIILTTHSPYVLDELPQEARIQIVPAAGRKEIMIGVSPEFAMTQMDEQVHPEVDVYVEDEVAKAFLLEILAKYRPSFVRRIQVIPYGSAQVGKSLGQMAAERRFPRPSVIFLDGDQDLAPGCTLLPGDEAPERVVFVDLQAAGWPDVASRLSRSHADLVDAAERAMTNPQHHAWLREVGDAVLVGGQEVWRAMVVSWVAECAPEQQFQVVLSAMDDAFGQ
jgi:predicted ATPase